MKKMANMVCLVGWMLLLPILRAQVMMDEGNKPLMFFLYTH